MSVIFGFDKRITKFLDLIAFSEGTSTNKLTQNDGYDVLVTDIHGSAIFDDYSTHPLSGKPARQVNKTLYSTAAGRYQIMLKNWLYYAPELDLPDFSPLSQDKLALELIRERHAFNMLLSDDISSAIKACSNIWASFPGNSYGQGGKSLQTLIDKYNSLV